MKPIRKQLSDSEKFVNKCLKLPDGKHIAEVLGDDKTGMYLAVGSNLSQNEMIIESKEVPVIREALNRYLFRPNAVGY